MAELKADLQVAHPMMRLIQGDVGSGKTVVAALACAQAVSAGVQVAVMAPTELLAEQHMRSFSDWFQNLDVELAGCQEVKNKRSAARRWRP